MTNGDTFNLASALADTSWNGAASTLGNFVSVASSGGNALVSINPTGTGTGGTLVATLHGAGTVSLQTLIAHSQT